MKIETCLFPSKFLVSCWVFVTSKSVWKASWIIHHLEPHMFLLLEDNLHIFRMTLTRGTSSSITNRPFVKKNQSLISPELKEKAAMRSNFDLDQKREVEEGGQGGGRREGSFKAAIYQYQ